MVAQCLRAPTGVNGQQMLQDARSDAIGHQGGKMGLQFVQLRCRSATRWPTDARLDAIAGDASKPGKRHRHCAKRRRYAMAPPVLQMTFSAAGRAARPLQPVAVGLRSNDRSLNARQKLLRFGQGQSQVSNIAKTFRPADLYQIGAQAAGITLRRNQPQHPSHPRSPGRLSTRPTVPSVSSYPHSLDTPSSQSGVQVARAVANAGLINNHTSAHGPFMANAR